MGVTQSKSAGIDRKQNAVPMIGGDFGDIITLTLTVLDNAATPLSDAVNYPVNPTVVGWVLHEAEVALRVSGTDVAASFGLLLSASPDTMALMTDPGKTHAFQNSGASKTVLLTLLGKNLR